MLFHSAAVMPLSPFLYLPPARFLRISIVCCCCGASFSLLVLSLPPARVVSSFPKLVPSYVVLECAPSLSAVGVLLLYTVLVCRPGVVFVCLVVGASILGCVGEVQGRY